MLVLGENAAQAVASSYVEVGNLVWISDLSGELGQRSGVPKALMRPVSVVELVELAQGVEQVPLVPDQGPVQQFTAAGLHPPLSQLDPFRIRAGTDVDAVEYADGCAIATPTRAWEFSYPTPTRSVGVHLRPWGLAPLLPMPAAELCDRPATVEQIWSRPAIAELRHRLTLADAPQDMLMVLEEELVRRLRVIPMPRTLCKVPAWQPLRCTPATPNS